MRVRTCLLASAAAAALIGFGSANAQTSGTTTGPAAGSPATLGTGGVTPTSPHQTEAIRNGGGVPVQAEQRGQLGGGTASSVKPGASDAGSGRTPPR